MEFPPRRVHFARTEDPTLSHFMARVNQCCGVLKGVSKNTKNAFYACLEGYNNLFKKEDKSEQEKSWENELLIVVRFLSSTSSNDRKDEYVKTHASKLLEILRNIGI